MAYSLVRREKSKNIGRTNYKRKTLSLERGPSTPCPGLRSRPSCRGHSLGSLVTEKACGATPTGLAGNLPSGTYRRSALQDTGKHIHREISHKRHSAAKPSRGDRETSGTWVSLPAMHCWSCALEKWQGPEAEDHSLTVRVQCWNQTLQGLPSANT